MNKQKPRQSLFPSRFQEAEESIYRETEEEKEDNDVFAVLRKYRLCPSLIIIYFKCLRRISSVEEALKIPRESCGKCVCVYCMSSLNDMVI